MKWIPLNSIWSFNERTRPKKITSQKRKSPTSTGPGLTRSTDSTTLETLIKRGRRHQLRNLRILLSTCLLWLPCMFLFRWNFFDSIVSFWTKRWMLILEISATFWRQRGNGAVEFSFESRTAKMSALFHIFTCALCLVCLINVAVAVLGCVQARARKIV